MLLVGICNEHVVSDTGAQSSGKHLAEMEAYVNLPSVHLWPLRHQFHLLWRAVFSPLSLLNPVVVSEPLNRPNVYIYVSKTSLAVSLTISIIFSLRTLPHNILEGLIRCCVQPKIMYRPSLLSKDSHFFVKRRKPFVRYMSILKCHPNCHM